MVESSYSNALTFVLHWEGGLSDNPTDHGRRTMRGITQGTYDAWRTAHGQPTQDVARIKDDELGAIYRQNYWTAAFCDRLRAMLDLVQFDTSVNMGPNRAVKILQAAVGTAADGAFGPQTQAACDSCGLPDAVAQFCEIREGIYRKLAEQPGQDVFLNGWLNRLDDLRAEAGVPGFSRSRGAETEPVARIADLKPDQPLEAWK